MFFTGKCCDYTFIGSPMPANYSSLVFLTNSNLEADNEIKHFNTNFTIKR